MPVDVHLLILAAGASARMAGADKLLMPVRGMPLLAHVTRQALATGCPVTVVLPADRPDRRAVLAGLGVTVVLLPDAGEGQSASLQAGLAALPADAPVMLLLADMPDLTTSDLQRVLTDWTATPALILRGAAEDGTPGHPVCLPVWTRADLGALRGDQGARAVLSRHSGQLRLVPLPGTRAITDLDTLEDWTRWRTARDGTGKPKDAAE